MNLDELTIGEARKLASMFPQALTTGSIPPSSHIAKLTVPVEIPVIVCTDKRGVFFGYTTDISGEIIKLRSSRMAFYWSANQGGVMGLASEGPRDGSKIGARADIELRGITCVMRCTPESVKAWEDGKWKT